jgi:hypothetical protein
VKLLQLNFVYLSILTVYVGVKYMYASSIKNQLVSSVYVSERAYGNNMKIFNCFSKQKHQNCGYLNYYIFEFFKLQVSLEKLLFFLCTICISFLFNTSFRAALKSYGIRHHTGRHNLSSGILSCQKEISEFFLPAANFFFFFNTKLNRSHQQYSILVYEFQL